MEKYPEDFLKALKKQKVINKYAKIIALNTQEQPLEEITGKIINGSINKDSKSIVRRTSNLSLVSENIDINDYLWGVKTKVKIEIGIENTINSDYPNIIWFPQGIFVLNDFKVNRTVNNCTISLSSQDKMCLLNGTLGGNIPQSVNFDSINETDENGKITKKKVYLGTLITELVHGYGLEEYHNIIIKDLPKNSLEVINYTGDNTLRMLYDKKNFQYLGSWGGNYDKNWKEYPSDTATELYIKNGHLTPIDTEFNPEKNKIYYIQSFEPGDYIGYKVIDLFFPNELNCSAGDTVTSVLDKIVKVFNQYQYYYNIDGQFIFEKKPEYLTASWTKDTLISEGLQISPEESKKINVNYDFLDNDFNVNLNNNPILTNIKNDYVIQGLKKSGAENKGNFIRYRIAIDKKPTRYVTYSEENKSHIQLQYRKTEGGGPAIVGHWFEKPIEEDSAITIDNKKYYTWTEKYTLPKKTIYVTDEKYLHDGERDKAVIVDWREIIYQMAKDYQQYNQNIDFLTKVAEKNPECIRGITGYEQYYTDILGYWRELYYKPYEIYSEEKILAGAQLRPEYTWNADKTGFINSNIINSIQEREELSPVYQDQYSKYHELQNKYYNEWRRLYANYKAGNIDKSTYETDLQNLKDKWFPLMDKEISFDENTGWRKGIEKEPDLGNFWIDFIETSGSLNKISVKNRGTLPLVLKEDMVNKIFTPNIPNIIWLEEGETIDPEYSSYQQIQTTPLKEGLKTFPNIHEAKRWLIDNRDKDIKEFIIDYSLTPDDFPYKDENNFKSTCDDVFQLMIDSDEQRHWGKEIFQKIYKTPYLKGQYIIPLELLGEDEEIQLKYATTNFRFPCLKDKKFLYVSQNLLNSKLLSNENINFAIDAEPINLILRNPFAKTPDIIINEKDGSETQHYKPVNLTYFNDNNEKKELKELNPNWSEEELQQSNFISPYLHNIDVSKWLNGYIRAKNRSADRLDPNDLADIEYINLQKEAKKVKERVFWYGKWNVSEDKIKKLGGGIFCNYYYSQANKPNFDYMPAEACSASLSFYPQTIEEAKTKTLTEEKENESGGYYLLTGKRVDDNGIFASSVISPQGCCFSLPSIADKIFSSYVEAEIALNKKELTADMIIGIDYNHLTKNYYKKIDEDQGWKGLDGHILLLKKEKSGEKYFWYYEDTGLSLEDVANNQGSYENIYNSIAVDGQNHRYVTLAEAGEVFLNDDAEIYERYVYINYDLKNYNYWLTQDGEDNRHGHYYEVIENSNTKNLELKLQECIDTTNKSYAKRYSDKIPEPYPILYDNRNPAKMCQGRNYGLNYNFLQKDSISYNDEYELRFVECNVTLVQNNKVELGTYKISPNINTDLTDMWLTCYYIKLTPWYIDKYIDKYKTFKLPLKSVYNIDQYEKATLEVLPSIKLGNIHADDTYNAWGTDQWITFRANKEDLSNMSGFISDDFPLGFNLSRWQKDDEGSYKYMDQAFLGLQTTKAVLPITAQDVFGEILNKHSNLAETVSLTSIPVYDLELQEKIALSNEDANIQGIYNIEKISIPLGHNGTMTVNASKQIENIY